MRLLSGLRWSIVLFALAGGSGAVNAADLDPATQFAVSKGQCLEVLIANKDGRCVDHPGLIQVRYRGGRSVLLLGLANRAAIAFVADAERRRGRTESVLDLSRVRLGRGSSAPATPVAGECRIQLSQDGGAWLNVACEATDRLGRSWRLLFRPTGRLEIERG